MYLRLEPIFAAVVLTLAFLGLVPAAIAGNKPVPLINQPLVPDAVVPGGPTFTLTVNGTGFVSKSRVYWNGSKKTTTFVSKSQLTAIISSADIATAGTASVTVADPAPIGGTSNVAFVSITNPTTNVGFRLGSSPATGDIPFSIAAGDFNGDGKLDLAVSNYESNTVSILLGDGAGNFTLVSSHATGNNPNSIAVGDFNGDGNLDLAVANDVSASSGSVVILLGDGTGNFTLAPTLTTGATNSVAVGDFNRDGNLDLAVPNYHDGTVSIFLGDGTGHLTLVSSPTTGSLPHSVAVGDFNGDDKLDLAVVNQDTVSILLGDGTGSFTLASSPAAGNFPYSIATGDFNGDGKLDLVVAGETVLILLGDGTGNFTQASSTGPGGYFIVAGDFNGDGNLDVAVAPVDDGSASVLLGDGTRKLTLAASPVPAASSAAVGDFNGDGKLDLATVSNTGKNLSIFLQAPAVSLAPGNLNFGDEMVGKMSPPQTATVTNVGYAAVSISGITLTGYDPQDFAQTNNCPSSLAVGASCTITVTFAPNEGDGLYATLSVSGDGGFNPPNISLSGIGLAIELSATSLNFGNVVVGQTSAPMFSTVTNIGTDSVKISRIVIKGTDPGDFSESDTCPTQLKAGGSCTITVTFTPTKTGSRTANVNIQDDGGGSPQRINLSGTGT